MDRLTRRRSVVAVVATLLVTAVIGAAAIGVTATADRTLVVSDADTGETLLEVPVDDGEEVTLSYTHSVEKTLVEDIYVVDGATLRMDRMVFSSHGAGLPSDAPLERTEEGFVYYSNASYEHVNVVPGSIAGHELVVGDNRYDLVELADGPVTVSLTDRTVLDAALADGNRSALNSNTTHMTTLL